MLGSNVGLDRVGLFDAFDRGLELHLEYLEAQKGAHQAGESPQFGTTMELLRRLEPRLARLDRAELVMVVAATLLFVIDLNNQLPDQGLRPGAS